MVFCDICDKENCELAEHRKKLKNLCRMCHTTLIKKKTVLIKSLPKLELFVNWMSIQGEFLFLFFCCK